uniref:CCZ1/INTU/HSP4 first Longin domain-containing protein n=1 Tax=Tetradesmus obliquus TaxID=3088 RepID=A0A383WJN5_TETOB|eukprot:jgi/Sobl393_1/8319/SZX76956.1
MHSNHATRAFFKSGTGVVLAVYDARKGQAEGAEAEKVLAFWPPSASPAMQSSIVGLAQALTMFAGTFNKECPFHSMQAHGHSWAMYHAEPDLWLLLLVGRGLVGPHCLPGSLAGCLKGLHSLVVLLHGLLSSQQGQDPSGVRLRARLQPLLAQAASSLLTPDACGLWPIACPLGLTGGVPLLPISPAAFTRLQSLANSLLVARLFGSRPVLGLLAAWQGCLLWSSMGSGDTAALASLAVRALEPAAREGPRHKTGCLLWSSLGSGDTAALASLAARALEPAAREGPRHKTVSEELWSSMGSSDTAALASLAVRALEPAAREGPRHKTQHGQRGHRGSGQLGGKSTGAGCTRGLETQDGEARAGWAVTTGWGRQLGKVPKAAAAANNAVSQLKTCLHVAWQGCLLWSSMGSGDTAALASLAVRALEPAAREGPRHKTVRRVWVGAGSTGVTKNGLPAGAGGTRGPETQDGEALAWAVTKREG